MRNILSSVVTLSSTGNSQILFKSAKGQGALQDFKFPLVHVSSYKK